MKYHTANSLRTALEEIIGQAKALDMVDVHAKIAEEQAKEATPDA